MDNTPLHFIAEIILYLMTKRLKKIQDRRKGENNLP